MAVHPELVALIRCPRCRGVLSLAGEGDTRLECPSCRVAYPVEGGIPTLLIEEAQPLPAGPVDAAMP